MPRPRKSTASLARAMNKLAVAVKPKRQYPRRSYAGSGLTGRGFYKGFGRDAGRVIGGGAGAALGLLGVGGFNPITGIAGANVGSKLGGTIGDMASKLTGWGSYRVHHNSIVQQVPSIKNPRKEGATQIRHREYIGDVLSSQNFQIQYQLAINAAQPTTFPWASQLSANFTQYEINGLMFEFVTTSGDATGSNTSLGEVMMATNYDSVLPPFVNKLQMLNQEFSSSVKPSSSSLHPIECSPNQTTIPLLYTRPSAPAPNTDIRVYDLGQFFLATQGNQSDGQTLGELWVTYDILLYKPLLGNGPDGQNETNAPTVVSFTQYSAGPSVGATPFGGTLGPFGPAINPGTVPWAYTGSVNGLNIVFQNVDTNNDAITFPPNSPGKYQITLTATSTQDMTGYSVNPTGAYFALNNNMFGFGVATVNAWSTAGGLNSWVAVITVTLLENSAPSVLNLGYVFPHGYVSWNTADCQITYSNKRNL